jgi:hypothetical protein
MKFLRISLLWLLGVSFSLAQGATPTLISILSSLAKCSTTAPQLILWSSNGFHCVPLPAGWTVVGNPPTLVVPSTTYTPIWQVETISLTSLAIGATSTTYTTKLPPVSGIVNYWYNCTNLLDCTSGAIAFTGQPLTFNLPLDWTSTDTITISYQSQ